MVIVIWRVFQLNIYALIYPSGTLCFVTSCVTIMFDVLHDMLKTFLSLHVGDSITLRGSIEKVSFPCPIELLFYTW